jgi:tetratricopeptide (TPR) repeat protein
MLRSPPAKIVLTVIVGLAVLSVGGCGGAEVRKAKHLEKGQAFLAAGNYEKARVEFQNAMQIAPKDGEARFEMGVVDEKLGNSREAAQYYQGTIDVQPDHVGARTNLARLFLLSGAYDRALEIIKPALEQKPDDPELLTVRAAARLAEKDSAGARSDAERAVRLAPTNENAVAVLAGIDNSEGQKAQAQELLENTVKKLPDTIDLRLILAQLYAQSGRPADAEATLLKLVQLKPAEKAHRLRLAQFYLQANQIDAAERTLRQAVKDLPDQRDLKFSLVQFLAARRSAEAAQKELQAMIAADPADNELKFALAKYYESVNDRPQAEVIYKGIIDKEQLGPDGLRARDSLAALRFQNNDVNGALALATEVLAKSPRDDDALVLRGNIAMSRQDPRAAIADLRAVLRDQPNAVGVVRALSRAHLANGEPAVAEETLRHAVEANPKNQVLELDFARLLMQLGKADQAKPVVGEIVKQSPDNLDALDLEFRVNAALKDYVSAKAAADALVALRPKVAVGYLYQGMLAEAQGRPDESLKLYSTAVDLQPAAVEPLEAEIRLLLTQKRLAEALRRLDDVAQREPKSSFALNIKGNVLVGNGRPAEAQEAFKAAIGRTPQWWLPYRGLAAAQLEAKQDPAVAIATLRDAKSVVAQKDVLGVELASLLERVGKIDDAIAQYEETVRAYPQSEAAANNLAMMLVTYKKDQPSLDRARELAVRFADSSNPSYLDTYGWVLYKRGEAAASVPVLERVVRMAPREAIAHFHLGMAQALAGDQTGARDNLTRAVSSGASFSGLDEAKAALATIAHSTVPTSSVPKT